MLSININPVNTISNLLEEAHETLNRLQHLLPSDESLIRIGDQIAKIINNPVFRRNLDLQVVDRLLISELSNEFFMVNYNFYYLKNSFSNAEKRIFDNAMESFTKAYLPFLREKQNVQSQLYLRLLSSNESHLLAKKHITSMQYILRYIAITNTPFRSADSQFLRLAMNTLDNTFVLPGKDKLREEMLNMAEQIKQKMKKKKTILVNSFPYYLTAAIGGEMIIKE